MGTTVKNLITAMSAVPEDTPADERLTAAAAVVGTDIDDAELYTGLHTEPGNPGPEHWQHQVRRELAGRLAHEGRTDVALASEAAVTEWLWWRLLPADLLNEALTRWPQATLRGLGGESGLDTYTDFEDPEGGVLAHMDPGLAASAAAAHPNDAARIPSIAFWAALPPDAAAPAVAAAPGAAAWNLMWALAYINPALMWSLADSLPALALESARTALAGNDYDRFLQLCLREPNAAIEADCCEDLAPADFLAVAVEGAAQQLEGRGRGYFDPHVLRDAFAAVHGDNR